MLKHVILSITALTIAAVGVSLGSVDKNSDAQVYNQIVAITGYVEILNNPELGRTAASGMYLVFQRDGCRKCLVATFADAKGNYKILVGQGRYRIIVHNPSPPTYDMIAPGQPRYVEATPKLQDTEFDIKLVVPSSR